MYKCDNCDIRITNMSYYIHVYNFYRNIIKKTLLFCCHKCEIKYKKSNICFFCNYDNNLIEFGGIKLCKIYPNNFSCFEKYTMMDTIDFSNTICKFCDKMCSNNIKHNNSFVCKICFIKYKLQFTSLIEYYSDSSSDNESESTKTYLNNMNCTILS